MTTETLEIRQALAISRIAGELPSCRRLYWTIQRKSAARLCWDCGLPARLPCRDRSTIMVSNGMISLYHTWSGLPFVSRVYGWTATTTKFAGGMITIDPSDRAFRAQSRRSSWVIYRMLFPSWTMASDSILAYAAMCLEKDCPWAQAGSCDHRAGCPQHPPHSSAHRLFLTKSWDNRPNHACSSCSAFTPNPALSPNNAAALSVIWRPILFPVPGSVCTAVR